jgi:hypothetical protein
MAMRIAALVIYQMVTLSGRNISRLDGPGLCSKVSGILNFPAPLTEFPVHSGHRAIGCGDTTVVTQEELCRWVNRQPTQRLAGSVVVAGDCSVSRPSIAIRQQFYFALLEDCSFFSHLVLRCVRGEDGPLHGVAVPSGARPRPDSGIEFGTRRVTHLCAQPELQNLSAGSSETYLPESERLWAELASRQVRISVCKGERP